MDLTDVQGKKSKGKLLNIPKVEMGEGYQSDKEAKPKETPLKEQPYDLDLSMRFEKSLREARSIKDFKEALKTRPDLKVAHKEYCKRKHYEVQKGRGFWDYVEIGVLWTLAALGGYAGVTVITNQVSSRQTDEQALEG